MPELKLFKLTVEQIKQRMDTADVLLSEKDFKMDSVPRDGRLCSHKTQEKPQVRMIRSEKSHMKTQ